MTDQAQLRKFIEDMDKVIELSKECRRRWTVQLLAARIRETWPTATSIGFNVTIEYAGHGQTFDAVSLADVVTAERHVARPDDDPEPGDRCKDCGKDIYWTGPGQHDWRHTDDPDDEDPADFDTEDLLFYLAHNEFEPDDATTYYVNLDTFELIDEPQN